MAGLFPGWKVVIGAGSGIAFGSAVFVSSSFSLLATAIGVQFGWSQSQLALGASLVLLMQIFSYPLVGALTDRIGSRLAAMMSISCFAGCLLLLSQVGTPLAGVMGDPLLQYYAAFFLIGLLAAGTNVVCYTRALTLWFDRRRGMAIGVAAAFQAVGATVLPVAFYKLITLWGWSGAVMGLAAFLVAFCLPMVAWLVKDSPAPFGLHPDGDAAPAPRKDDAGLPARPRFSVLIGDPRFRSLAIAFSVLGFAGYALSTNAVYILTTTAGLTVGEVATVQAVWGASVLLGRVGFGYLLDRFDSAPVALLAVLLGAGVFISYGMGGSYASIMVTAIVAGIAIGGESDLIPYLAGRYFGKDAVSTVFGWFLSAFAVGAALGPITFAQASAALKGPELVLFAIAALHIVPAVLFLGLRQKATSPAQS